MNIASRLTHRLEASKPEAFSLYEEPALGILRDRLPNASLCSSADLSGSGRAVSPKNLSELWFAI